MSIDGNSADPSPWQVYVVMAMTAIIGLLLLGVGGYGWVNYQEQVQDVEQTEATIISSDVFHDIANSEYDADIRYEYTVDGEVYRSSNVFPGINPSLNQSKAQEIVESHPEGETATVYYDPEDPSTAFLIKRDPPWEIIVTPGTIGVFALFLAYQFRGYLGDSEESSEGPDDSGGYLLGLIFIVIGIFLAFTLVGAVIGIPLIISGYRKIN